MSSSDENWSYKQTKLGALEYCPDGCTLTRGEVAELFPGDADIYVSMPHTESKIAQARLRRQQNKSTLGINIGRIQ